MFYHFEKRLNHTHIVTCLIENFQVKLKAIDTQDRKKRKCNLYLAEHGEILDAFVIISNEIHHFMSMLSELLSVHRLQFIIPADSKINHRLTETKINSRNPYNGVMTYISLPGLLETESGKSGSNQCLCRKSFYACFYLRSMEKWKNSEDDDSIGWILFFRLG